MGTGNKHNDKKAKGFSLTDSEDERKKGRCCDKNSYVAHLQYIRKIITQTVEDSLEIERCNTSAASTNNENLCRCCLIKNCTAKMLP